MKVHEQNLFLWPPLGIFVIVPIGVLLAELGRIITNCNPLLIQITFR